jgi:hypothetical protein
MARFTSSRCSSVSRPPPGLVSIDVGQVACQASELAQRLVL